MSHYTLDELIDLWKSERLTAEQAIGQLLLMLREQEQRMREILRRLPPDDQAESRANRSPERQERR